MVWLKRIGLALLLLIGLFVTIGFFLPKDYTVARSITIDAEPAQIHSMVGELKNWPEWSPWIEADPTIVTTLGATTTGVGASQTWTSEQGPGALTFTQCSAENGVVYDMDFGEGTYTSVGAIRYEKEGAGTKVTWDMEGEMTNILGRYFGLMMDSMVGPMFDVGLEKLKTAVEAMPPAPVPELEEPVGPVGEEA